MPRKLTDALIRKIRAEAKRGTPEREIAARFGVSKGSVGNALKRAPKRRRASPKPPLAPELELPPAAAPTLDSLAQDVATQLHGLRADAARARGAGDDLALGRAQRLATTLTVVLARLTRDAPLADGQLLVDREEIAAIAKRTREKLFEYFEREIKRT